MTEHMVIIAGDADRWWTTMSMAERKEGYAEYERFARELTARGHRITGGGELRPTTEAVHIKGGTDVVTDGPFTEANEHVGGFYTIETDDVDDLARCCTIITALGDSVEIRRLVRPEERPS